MRSPAPCLPLSLGLLAMAGCGGGSSPAASSTTPVTTAPAAPVVRDGWTDQPVAAELSPPAPTVGQRLLIEAPGYLTREQAYRNEPIQLWPAEEEYARQLVYDWEFTDGSFRMVRWAGPFTVSLEGDLASDEEVLAKVREVVDELSSRSGLSIDVGPGGECVIKIDPSLADQGWVGLAYNSFRGATITGAEVSFVNRGEILGRVRSGRSDYTNTLLHEMGHVLGLAHSPDTADVMTPGEGPGTLLDRFNTGEAVALHMMYAHRTAGNRPPDLDPGLSASSDATPRFPAIPD